MGYDSLRNKNLLKFPDGKLMLLAEISDSRTFDWRGRRCWDWTLFHPKGTLFYTEETLKQKQTEYVENQLQWLRNFNRKQVEDGWLTEYTEPTIESHDYCGTVFPGGSRIKNGRAFYGGRPKKAEDFFSVWGNPEEITFEAYDKDYNTLERETYNILRKDIDECYQDFLEKYDRVCIGVR